MFVYFVLFNILRDTIWTTSATHWLRTLLVTRFGYISDPRRALYTANIAVLVPCNVDQEYYPQPDYINTHYTYYVNT